MIKLKHLLPECNECARDWNHGHDHEAGMAKNELRDAISNASKIDQMIGEGDNLPGWVSAYISLAADYMHSVAEYLAGESSRMQEPGPGYGIEEKKKMSAKDVFSKDLSKDKEHKDALRKALPDRLDFVAQSGRGKPTFTPPIVKGVPVVPDVTKQDPFIDRFVDPEKYQDLDDDDDIYEALNEGIDLRKVQSADNAVRNLLRNISTNSNIPTTDKVGILEALKELQQFVDEVGYEVEMEDEEEYVSDYAKRRAQEKNLEEKKAHSKAQQAAIAIAMQKAGKKPK